MKKRMMDGGFEETATAEERALARALDACGVPPLPGGAVAAIHLRAQAEAAARRRAVRRAWMSAAAAVALAAGAWGAVRWRGGGADTAAAGAGNAPDAEAAARAEAEVEDWLSPYAAEFEELETTLLAFESMDFAGEDSAFPSL